MKLSRVVIAVMLLRVGFAQQTLVSHPVVQASTGQQAAIAPLVDHHTHLFSPAALELGSEAPLPAIKVPQDIGDLIRDREQAWNNKSALAAVYMEDAITLNTIDSGRPTWIRGRDDIAGFLSALFDSPYHITPVAFRADGVSAQVAGYFTDVAPAKHFGEVFFSLHRKSDGCWSIATEIPTFPSLPKLKSITADELISQLDAAGIRRAVVLSVAYFFGSPFHKPVQDEYGRVRAENDWTAQQVARFPDRLVAFCSFNPLKDYALQELDRCAQNRFKGVKLHFGNSAVDLRNAEHLAKLKQVFRAANEHKLPIVVHLWTDPTYEQKGGEYAQVFLNQLLPEAPDVTIQITHMAGGGRSTDSAMAVFADAITKNDPRTKSLYFDMATLVEGESEEGLQRDAMRIRQIGIDRFLYGTDMAPPNPPARQAWVAFRIKLPLTENEFRTIAANVAPYLR